MTVSEEKKALRPSAEALRRALAQEAPEAGALIADRFLVALAPKTPLTVAGYMPARSEADPLPLMARLRDEGVAIALARVAAKNAPLAFHLWPEGAAPVQGAFGLREADATWPVAAPDILLVPLLAFDSHGHRLGYGGGFYDRTLRARRAGGAVLAVGIGFAGQQHATALPRDAYDEKLDWVVTERDVWQFERN